MKNTGIRVLVLLCSIAILYGCAGATNDDSKSGKKTIIQEESSEGTFPGLSAETERQIKLDFMSEWNLEFDDVNFVDYFGTYNGCVVLIINSDELAYIGVAQVIRNVSNKIFYFDVRNQICIWKQGLNLPEEGIRNGFINLKDAYELGFITEEDVDAIYEIYKSRGGV